MSTKPTYIKANVVLESEPNEALANVAERIGMTKSALLNALIKLGLGLRSDDPDTVRVHDYGLHRPVRSVESVFLPDEAQMSEMALPKRDALVSRNPSPGRPLRHSPKSPDAGEEAKKREFAFKRVGEGDTILSSTALKVMETASDQTLLSLLSCARSEYLTDESLEGPFMRKMMVFFEQLADFAYDGGVFRWSDYNRKQWEKFCSSVARSHEGGSCVFSLEPDGDYRSEIHDTFRALFLGVPTGMWPYSISIRNHLAKVPTEILRDYISKSGHSI